MSDEPTPIVDLFQAAADIADAMASAPRAEVVRTRLDEEREPIPDLVRYAVLRRDRFRCVWCGDRRMLQMDHIVPWSAGGSDDIDNLRTLCQDCNERRSNRYTQLDLATREPNGSHCLRCDPGDRLDDMAIIWCTMCSARGIGYPDRKAMS